MSASGPFFFITGNMFDRTRMLVSPGDQLSISANFGDPAGLFTQGSVDFLGNGVFEIAQIPQHLAYDGSERRTVPRVEALAETAGYKRTEMPDGNGDYDWRKRMRREDSVEQNSADHEPLERNIQALHASLIEQKENIDKLVIALPRGDRSHPAREPPLSSIRQFWAVRLKKGQENEL
jgi:hypothetical protein